MLVLVKAVILPQSPSEELFPGNSTWGISKHLFVFTRQIDLQMQGKFRSYRGTKPKDTVTWGNSASHKDIHYSPKPQAHPDRVAGEEGIGLPCLCAPAPFSLFPHKQNGEHWKSS